MEQGLEVCISKSVIGRLPDPKLDQRERLEKAQEAGRAAARNES